MAAELAYITPNIATIRFSACNKATTWRVKRGAREKSVGSLFGTIFVFLFGSSLLGIMLCRKPLSPFSALHSFCSKIAEGYQQGYAYMRTNIKKIVVFWKYLLN
ncbi:hypothetical protein FA13DRAFT_1745041 [Coprinellus micaceus]|uniref:Uncharacterized protein n=1 Tax=Coprinellus micaceus TaxID=71717 RepID=A0A4Y7SB42_COPMI|nr:hypothetical protein FA13DRAFT_1745041 [Coprinellus micaceus]